jgi:hypothetical protein
MSAASGAIELSGFEHRFLGAAALETNAEWAGRES